jgi:glyoxylase-like metal-dependent hydrolase (beta-lactamase superfamily II)
MGNARFSETGCVQYRIPAGTKRDSGMAQRMGSNMASDDGIFDLRRPRCHPRRLARHQTRVARARRLADRYGQEPDQIYITHGHADHFFGLNTVLETHPEAKAVALAQIMPFVAEQTTPAWMQIWASIFPDQLFGQPAVPVALEKPELTVEGHALIPVKLGQSDVSDSSVVHIPDLDTLIAGDVIYNGIHVWMYQSDHDHRTAWIETINEVEKLHLATIIAGHTDPGAPSNDGSRLLNQTRQCIHDFDQAVAASSSGQEVVSRMTAKYPGLGNPYTLWLAAYTQPCGQ